MSRFLAIDDPKVLGSFPDSSTFAAPGCRSISVTCKFFVTYLQITRLASGLPRRIIN